jgi:hypothetical protein
VRLEHAGHDAQEFDLVMTSEQVEHALNAVRVAVRPIVGLENFRGSHDASISSSSTTLAGPFACHFLYYTNCHFKLGGQFMRALRCLLALVLALLIGGSAVLAQETPKGFLGIELEDITKDEAEALGWEAPRGIKVVKPREGGPAASAGILPDDMILSIDGVEVENAQRFVATIGDRGAGAQVRLRVLRSGNERTLSVTLGQRPAELAQPVAVKQDLPVLMLDTGGHMAVITGLAFTPDGKQLVSAGDDKVIRVWDWQAGKTIRTIRGQVAPGNEGKVFAMALSPRRALAGGRRMDGPRVRRALRGYPSLRLRHGQTRRTARRPHRCRS